MMSDELKQYYPETMLYINSVDGAAHQSAVDIIERLQKESCKPFPVYTGNPKDGWVLSFKELNRIKERMIDYEIYKEVIIEEIIIILVMLGYMRIEDTKKEDENEQSKDPRESQ